MRKACFVLVVIAMATFGAPASSKAPATWDGLVQVKAKNVELAYLLPHADFRAYSKVMFDPAEVAFRKNWLRDYNRSTATLGGRISDSEAREKLELARQTLDKLFADAFVKEGYQIVTAPGPDVLRLSVGVIDLSVTAPDTSVSTRSRTYSYDAGEATLVVEARDSVTNQLLGRAIDERAAGEGPTYRRTYASNEADFEALFDNWARISARALGNLKAMSPVDTDGIKKQ
ncbi:MAG TPA: DUF3313 family protein [Sphingomicrobium sp.]|nr:DUF3313 family protein [Sphingomicrobium sp.]